MLFNTVTYAYFFAAVFILSWLLAPWRKARLGFILVSSYVFYAGWTFVGWDKLMAAEGPAFWQALFQSIKYVPLLFVATSIDFYLGILLDRISDARRRKAMVVATILLNVGILVFFKYWNWGADTFMWLFGKKLGFAVPDIHMRVDLPIGISFFCFMSLSYVIDVYRRTIPACTSYLNYLTYISFFPHLVAGPIIRGRDLLPHLERETRLTSATGSEGLFLVASGLFKKVVIGDYLAVNFVDRVYGDPSAFSAIEALMGMYGYAVQVYCDFSGYSDVAIGSALLLGYRFKINFDAPYKAANLVEFWRRWHISLSTWLRDYVYIPLGGSRRGRLRKYFNVFATMVICGVWHGAAWTFVIFGATHGLVLGATHYFHEVRKEAGLAKAAGVALLASGAFWLAATRFCYYLKLPGMALGVSMLVAGGWVVAILIHGARSVLGEGESLGLKAFGIFANFTFVSLSFAMFRAASMDKAGAMYERLISGTSYTKNLHPIVMAIMAGALILQWTPRSFYEKARDLFMRAPAPVQAAILFAVAFAMRKAATAEAVPFVYFQF